MRNGRDKVLVERKYLNYNLIQHVQYRHQPKYFEYFLDEYNNIDSFDFHIISYEKWIDY